MLSIIQKVKNKIIGVWKIADEVARHKAVRTIEAEVEELNNILHCPLCP